VWFRGD
jgi:hypothetical protein